MAVKIKHSIAACAENHTKNSRTHCRQNAILLSLTLAVYTVIIELETFFLMTRQP
jgi:hypothetical protein